MSQPSQSRLVDYFVVVGYDHEKRAGKIIQRFPENDWPDTPFHHGIEMFCQPQGWRLSSAARVPEFFVSVLTDVDAYRHYCACLTFAEPFTPAASPTADELDDEEPHADSEDDAGDVRVKFATKCLCVVSRHEYFDVFRQCLGIILTVHLEKTSLKLEKLVGTLLGHVVVPPPGGPQIRFSIGADDWQFVQPSQSAAVPTSRESILVLCRELGVSNVLRLLCAALVDAKILFLSSSYNRLADAAHALTSIFYPMKYSYVYVPILPAPLLEVLNTPTPFIMGVHASLKEQVENLVLDVIIVDLDACDLPKWPDNLALPSAASAVYAQTLQALKMVLDPSLVSSDHAFPNGNSSRNSSDLQDKELRAVFLWFLCQILAGYRSCLTVVRLHPQPVITFQKAQFLGQRNLVGDEFVTRVISSMSFGRFIQEYASPFRQQTVFDEVYTSIQYLRDGGKGDEDDVSRREELLKRIAIIASRLYVNENPQGHAAPFANKCLRPSTAALLRPTSQPFPLLDADAVEEVLQEGVRRTSAAKWPGLTPPPSQVIPLGPAASAGSAPVYNARRLEVLSTCIAHVFEKRINDAKKLIPAAVRVLSSPSARLALARDLAGRVHSSQAVLEHEQFELVCKLINCALQDDGGEALDEHGVAAAFMPIVCAFCRKLSTGVIQFAYTKVQDHDIWGSLSFWESAFYKDVQQHITSLYWPAMLTPDSPERSKNGTGNEVLPSSALDIAADQLRSFAGNSPDAQKELIEREESTVFSQAIHYAHRIVYLRVPLDASSTAARLRRRPSLNGDAHSSSIVTNSYQESDVGSLSDESGFQEEERGGRELSCSAVKKFIAKFVDKVCSESHVTEEHIRQLHQMIPGVVDMHVDGLEAVYRESRSLQPVLKNRIMRPTLLSGEDMVMDGLRGHLLMDGRLEGAHLIPCEGALFLTTYRVVFMGVPRDSYLSDYIVVRSFPVAALTKEKMLNAQTYMSQLEHYAPEGIQLRSSTFQLLKIGFDEEVTRDVIEHFRKFLERIRYPLHVSELLNQGLSTHQAVMSLTKSGKKVAGFKGFAKKTLLRTAKAAGLKPKTVKKDFRGYNPTSTPIPERKMQLSLAVPRAGPARAVFEEESSDRDDDGGDTLAPVMKEAHSFERVIDRSYVKDYRRMGLIPSLSNISKRMDTYRLCQVNLHYKICPSYPALFVVPNSISDDGIRSLARHFKHNRFPLVVWQHPRTRAVLLRSSTYQHTRMSNVFKNSSMSTAGSLMTIPVGPQHDALTVTTSTSSSSQADFDKFLSALSHSLPLSITRRPSMTSVMNLNITPDAARRGSGTAGMPWNRAVQTLKPGTNGKPKSQRSSIFFSTDKSGSLYTNQSDSSYRSEASVAEYATPETASVAPSSTGSAAAPTLYILADKANLKSLRGDSIRFQVVPLDYPDIRRIKTAFKSLLQVVVPSSMDAKQPGPRADYGQAVENLDWLRQVQKLLRVAGTVVDLLDSQGASVLLSLEEGWDASCQISALAQLLLDPYYRRVEGFAVLVEKEFAALGYRFGHRNCLMQGGQNSAVAPVFLQFLDCVAQLQRQFPLSFEFNAFYLKFLAYHSTSNRFTNFLADCEAERVEMGLENRNYEEQMEELDPLAWPVAFGSVWKYIGIMHKRTTKFYNFLYAPLPLEEDSILRPFTERHNIVLWEYYHEEALSHGTLYDLELVEETEEEGEAESKGKTLGSSNSSSQASLAKRAMTKSSVKPVEAQRRLLMNGYNNSLHTVASAFAGLLEEIAQLEEELADAGSPTWQDVWQRVDEESQLILPLKPPAAAPTGASHMIRSHSRRLQTQTTLEILHDGLGKSPDAAGRHTSEGTMRAAQAHRFVKQTALYTAAATCGACGALLWANGKQAMRCTLCGCHVHERCVGSVAKNCAGSTGNGESDPGTLQPEGGGARHILVERESLLVGTQRENSPANTPVRHGQPDGAGLQGGGGGSGESRVMEGYLFKRAAVLTGWKQKWFVLDSIKHEIRYYEHSQEREVRGRIDLSEVTSVAARVPGSSSTAPFTVTKEGPRRLDETACFEVRTAKRVFSLCAHSALNAQEWIDRIQMCLQ
ncbi:myotubularin-related protein 5-like [Paramacrobiotus metropolitanus]|uniref:myotubularin-related protein 5-like n=1 Tax=Paramacrobiotus metropolitanus TaxID=2943436 RepID=UPI002446279E|nr:myotubularin-related protein 5-like [Paramacrobiotus metropolitanus]XP_055354319.1 myotubularin-related protein 5-like [Paramacrobiotus metropolitanus]XP_055354320.1 myotubularin-related protein 5-like [Paramacrobiotus metropolitanus]XP_055354321.1 myotubularin-related protein 5-like [Paramacrobiotus metropolitanus]